MDSLSALNHMWFPQQFDDPETLIETLREHLKNGDLFFAVSDGALNGRSVCHADLDDGGAAISAMNDPSLVYAATNRGNVILPIASFQTNQNLGSAKLQTLIDFNPLAENRMLDKWTENSLLGYLSMAFHRMDWLNRFVLPLQVRDSDLPFNIESIDTEHTVLIRG